MKKYINCVYDTEEDTFEVLDIEDETNEEAQNEKITRKGKIGVICANILLVALMYIVLMGYFRMLFRFIDEGFREGFRILSISIVFIFSFAVSEFAIIEIQNEE